MRKEARARIGWDGIGAVIIRVQGRAKHRSLANLTADECRAEHSAG